MNRQLSLFLELVKFRLSSLATFATASGYVVASQKGHLGIPFVLTVLGAFFIGGGANAMNQFMEQRWDAQMERTKSRVIPRGALTAKTAMMCAVGSSLVGFAFLWSVNLSTALIGLLMWLLYVIVYTPLKRTSALNVFAGSFCGALPPLIGWFGAGKSFSPIAFLLFFQLLVWQIPHFAAIAWKYRHEYSKAGFKMPFLNDRFVVIEKIFVVMTSGMYLLSTAMFFQAGICEGVMWFLSVLVAVFFMVVIFLFINNPEKPLARLAVFLSILSLSCSYIGLWIHDFIQ